MICIGVFGNEKGLQTLEILMRLYSENGINAVLGSIDEYHCYYNKYRGDFTNSHINIFIICIKNDDDAKDLIANTVFDIFVYLNSNAYSSFNGIKDVGSKNILVANCDEKSIFPFCVGIGTTLITCGLNSKASITASSITTEERISQMQCCVQRTIKTISQKEIEPMEFSVSFPSKYNISYVLTVLAVALICDINIVD